MEVRDTVRWPDTKGNLVTQRVNLGAEKIREPRPVRSPKWLKTIYLRDSEFLEPANW